MKAEKSIIVLLTILFCCGAKNATAQVYENLGGTYIQESKISYIILEPQSECEKLAYRSVITKAMEGLSNGTRRELNNIIASGSYPMPSNYVKAYHEKVKVVCDKSAIKVDKNDKNTAQTNTNTNVNTSQNINNNYSSGMAETGAAIGIAIAETNQQANEQVELSRVEYENGTRAREEEYAFTGRQFAAQRATSISKTVVYKRKDTDAKIQMMLVVPVQTEL